MTQDTSTTSAAPTPEQDMAALVSKVADLSKLALDMTRLCIEVNGKWSLLLRPSFVFIFNPREPPRRHQGQGGCRRRGGNS